MSYPGSKGQAGTYQLIIGQMPPHEYYCEAFAGSAKIFRVKRPAKVTWLIEKDPAQFRKLQAEFGSMRHVCLYNEDAIEHLTRCAFSRQCVLYCDPPYVLSTRQGRLYYDHEMTDAQHLALLQVLKNMDCNILLSGYPSALYSSQLPDWRCVQYRTRTRGRTLTECLWCNFPEPMELHDWRFAGQNYRQRLSLKRLAARWLARLEAMPPRKRGFVLDTIAQRHTQR